jgi:hypothetical protein
LAHRPPQSRKAVNALLQPWRRCSATLLSSFDFILHLDVPPGTALSFTSASDWLKFTTNTSIAFDSRYDLKRVRLRVGYPSTQEFAVITITCSKPSTGDSGFQFDLPIQISGTFWRTLGFGAAIGVLLAAQQIFAVWNNPNLPPKNAVVSTIASLIIGLVTGVLATFGLRKPV